MAIFFAEAGGGATGALEFYTTSGGNFSVTATNARPSSPRCIALSRGNTSAQGFVSKASTGTTYRRVSLYVRFPDLPTANDYVLQVGLTGSGYGLGLRVNSTGTISFFDPTSGTVWATSSNTVPTATWFRLTLTATASSATSWSAKAYINGVEALSTSDAATLSSWSLYLTIGPTGDTSQTGSISISDVYVDDTASLADPGNINVTPKKPASSTSAGFSRLIGTSRLAAVTDFPISFGQYIAHTMGTDASETFTVQSRSEGTADITGATVLGVIPWVYAYRTTATGYRGVYTAQNKSAGTSLVVNVNEAYKGDHILIAFGMDGATGTISATDGDGNTYTVDVDKAAASPGATNVRGAIIRGYVANQPTGALAVTITHPSVTARAAVAGVFAGIPQTSPLDKSASGVGQSAAYDSGTTATTAQNNEIVVGGAVIEMDASGTTYTVGNGMTPDGTGIANVATSGGGQASNVFTGLAYAIQSTASAQQHNGTNTSTDWVALLATYKGSAPGEGSPKLIYEGSEYALSLTISGALYWRINEGSTYPSNANGIGMRSTGTIQETFLIECGTVVVYIPGAGIPLAPHYQLQALIQR